MSQQPGLAANIINGGAPSSGGYMGQGLGMIGAIEPSSDANS